MPDEPRKCTTTSSIQIKIEKPVPLQHDDESDVPDDEWPPTPPANPSDDLTDTFNEEREAFPGKNVNQSLEEEASESEANDDHAGEQSAGRGPAWKSFHDRFLAKAVAETKPFFKEVDQKWTHVANQLATRTANTAYPLARHRRPL